MIGLFSFAKRQYMCYQSLTNAWAASATNYECLNLKPLVA